MQKVILSDEITVYQGDALQVLIDLPDASVDAVLTDPPYSSGGMNTAARQIDPASKYQSSGTKRCYPPMLGDAKDQRSWTHWCALWLAECWRLSKDGAPLMVFTDWRQLPSLTDAVQIAGWKWMGIVPWDKGNARPQLGKFRQQCEYVLFASKGVFKAATRRCLPGMYKHAVIAQQKIHLTSKPLALMHDLLAITIEGDTVLDPFMGGGTTGVACAETGRQFVGAELSPEYFEVATNRIKQSLLV